MADNFGEMWRKLLLYCPFAPIPLCQDWINERYRQALDFTTWGGQTAESQFIIPAASSTGTITLTNGSTAVVGVGTAWTSSHEGRQLYIGGAGPYYTVSTVTDATNLILERPYGGSTTAGSAYEIAQAYVTPPSDFLAFKTIKDPVNNWRLRFNKSPEWLDRIDAKRATTGSARYFVDYRHSSSNIPRYEVWPRVTTQSVYPFLYVKRPADMSVDSDTPMAPLRGDEIFTGALADLATWPGTESRPNPMFNLALAQKYEKDFQEYLQTLQRVDQDTYMTDVIGPQDSWDGLSDFPIDAAFAQSHDVF